MAGDSSMRLGSTRPFVSQGVTRPSLRARTVARGFDPASRKAGPGRGPSRVEAPMSGPAVCVGVAGRWISPSTVWRAVDSW